MFESSRHPERSERIAYVSSQLLTRAALLTRLLVSQVGGELSRTEVGLLSTLSGGPRRITELAELERLKQPTMTLLVQRLEQQGLVRRERHADDGRALRVSLTEAGRVAQRRAMKGTVALREALADLIPADEVETLLGHLRRIAEGMSAADTPPTRGARAAQAASRSARTSPGARPETVD
jgi:DNA-binding MarR family transcriptional regulator